MKLETFLKLAKSYSEMGWAVCAQLDDVLSGDAMECNPNALDYLAAFLKRAAKLGVEGAAETLETVNEAIARLRGGEQ